MKKRTTILIMLAALLFMTNGVAQMQIGPKVGVNIANLGGDDADELIGESLDSKTGFGGGIFFMYQFSNMFAIQPEAYYSMKGATYKENGGELTITLDYFEVPLLLKLIIPVEGSNIRPSIFAGPSVGFNTTAKSKVEFEGESAEEDLENVKKTEFGFVFGGGLGFLIGKNELGFDIRYILGLSTIDDSSDAADLKNTAFSFNVYFGFSLQ
jgi:hypothetical protein